MRSFMQRIARYSTQNSPFRARGTNPLLTASTRLKNQRISYYVGSVIVGFVGLSYCAVPLYEMLCNATGLDGTPRKANESREDVRPVRGAKPIKVTFDSACNVNWKFAPVTKELYVVPGETALAFFEASNDSDEDIVGIATYSVVPAKAAQYFNKIQCFCFEEQLLQKGEAVDMPVFFFIDPEFAADPWMRDVSHITLHYTFFKSKVQPENFHSVFGNNQSVGSSNQGDVIRQVQ